MSDCIKTMFRDFKSGGYNLEATRVTGERLIALILLLCLSYSFTTFSGQNLKNKGIAKYITRPTETSRIYQRHSNFSLSLHSQNWLESINFFQDVVQELLCLSPHKLPYYLKGMRAISLLQSAF